MSGAVTAMLAYSFDLIKLYKRVANNINAEKRGVKPGNIPIYPVTKLRVIRQPQDSQTAGAFRTSCARRECR